jgi:hypothetical protein
MVSPKRGGSGLLATRRSPVVVVGRVVLLAGGAVTLFVLVLAVAVLVSAR